MYVISDECVSCGSCAGVCPMEAIDMDDAAGHYMIDQDKCIGCGSCVDTCPMGAISQAE